ncbi:MAG TPA: nickel pincer cofactor biosynthesis protein LarB [Gemmatimonadaceae bacterium]|nr:nickel pincer cofactor biosynthesis protein LarB [Gemmatimonadaceae bacterium]
MIRERVRDLLRQVAAGAIDVDAAVDRLAFAPAESLGFATVDHHRALRQGYPEVILGAGKTPDQTVAIAERIAERGDGFLATRCEVRTQEALAGAFPAAVVNRLGRTVRLPGSRVEEPSRGAALIVTAGTSDLPVAEEAAETCAAMCTRVTRLTDVGVAGIHRVLARREELQGARVVIVVAGMDGALPSVVGGLVAAPVIAVPTSVGYGASFGGVAALLAMLNSCASGVTVVNIDNGFGAAVAASRIIHAA